jgi:hypothetical protein
LSSTRFKRYYIPLTGKGKLAIKAEAASRTERYPSDKLKNALYPFSVGLAEQK